MPDPFPLVSVVILSFDRPHFLAKSLESVVLQSYKQLEVIVVDNKSKSSDEIAKIVGLFPNIRLVANSINLGFTGGMNRGIEAATGDYVHCTLDDIVLDKDCIRMLVEHASKQASKEGGDGLLSGIILKEDGQTIHCAGGDFLLSAIYRKTVFGAGEKNNETYQEPYHVKYVPGCMIFARLDFMRRLNGFREDFFMYAEDTDLCARVLKAGHEIMVVPQAKATDLDAPHGVTREAIAFHKIKNLFTLYLLHAELRVLPEFYLRYGVINLGRAIISDRKIAWPMIRAWGWFLLNLPALLRDRYGSAAAQTVVAQTVESAQIRLGSSAD